MSFDLSGKRALVTGASKGIGAAVARALAQAGADVMVSARDASGLEQTAQEVRGAGREVHLISADLSHLEEVNRLVDEALAHWEVDILVNNAGISYPESALDTSEVSWDKVTSRAAN